MLDHQTGSHCIWYSPRAFRLSIQKHGEEIAVAPSQKEYSGRFNIRIDKRVHCDLAVEAVRSGITLNALALVAQKLALTVKHLGAREDRQNRLRPLQIMV